MSTAAVPLLARGFRKHIHESIARHQLDRDSADRLQDMVCSPTTGDAAVLWLTSSAYRVHWRLLRAHLGSGQHKSPAVKTLVLLLESGAIYGLLIVSSGLCVARVDSLLMAGMVAPYDRSSWSRLRRALHSLQGRRCTRTRSSEYSRTTPTHASSTLS